MPRELIKETVEFYDGIPMFGRCTHDAFTYYLLLLEENPMKYILIPINGNTIIFNKNWLHEYERQGDEIVHIEIETYESKMRLLSYYNIDLTDHGIDWK